jgi:hypothetical protein
VVVAEYEKMARVREDAIGLGAWAMLRKLKQFEGSFSAETNGGTSGDVGTEFGAQRSGEKRACA